MNWEFLALEGSMNHYELSLPTRYLLRVLWRRLIGRDSSIKLRLFAGKQYFILNMDAP